MVWGTRAGVDDLLQKLQQPKTGTSLCVLSTRKITAADAAKLAAAIATNSTLQELYFSGHKLGQAGLDAFAECLAVNTTLKHLSIGEDALGDAGVAALSAGLARNAGSAVEVWDLEHKSVGLAGASALGGLLVANSSLRSLTLARNNVGDEGVKALVAGLPSSSQTRLDTLTLTETAISGAALDHLAAWLAAPHASAAFFEALAVNKSLKKLLLKDCQLQAAHGEALAAALKANVSLEHVDVSDNPLGDAGCRAISAALAVNTSLQALTLDNAGCTDATAVAFGRVLAAENATLRFLDVSKSGLSHVGVSALLKATSVRRLRLFHNALGEGLTTALPELVANSTIEYLDLGANALHGALSVALFDALHAHPSLQTLEMGGNSLGEQGHDALERLKAANPTLDVAVDKNAQNEDGGFDMNG
ncbi:hypothetical protein P43SY_010567 [Pythium insidiosum]|uniref:Uncharacterized protein n=1 Tax=Pythium insidiosum TaxID=114742 RepID=A0AAD5LSJ2_PYTIN|nr:hypothetical protein P43SY_010567 [Pythium insidiosum]